MFKQLIQETPGVSLGLSDALSACSVSLDTSALVKSTAHVRPVDVAGRLCAPPQCAGYADSLNKIFGRAEW